MFIMLPCVLRLHNPRRGHFHSDNGYEANQNIMGPKCKYSVVTLLGKVWTYSPTVDHPAAAIVYHVVIGFLKTSSSVKKIHSLDFLSSDGKFNTLDKEIKYIIGDKVFVDFSIVLN